MKIPALACALFCLFIPTKGKPAQASSNSDVLNAEAKKFLDYSRDFLDVRRALTNEHLGESLDYQIALELMEVASHNNERSSLLGSLLAVYEGTDCSERHAAHHMMVSEEILTASRQIDNDIRAVQIDINDTHKPGLAAEALRMKDDLRALKEKLEQIRQSLDQGQRGARRQNKN